MQNNQITLCKNRNGTHGCSSLHEGVHVITLGI